MNGLVTLIDERIKKNGAGVTIVPCTVLELKDNQFVKVATVANGDVYTVLNESGSNVEVGETVQVAYSGLLTGKNAYIIASKNKSSEGKYANIVGSVQVGALFETYRIVGNLGAKANDITNCVLYVNCNMNTSTDGEAEFMVEVNGSTHSFSPKTSLVTNEYKYLSFQIPIVLASGANEVYVYAKGVGNVLSMETFIGGHGIEAYAVYDPTGDNDYIYNTSSNTSNVIYYIGDSIRPRMPLTLSNKAIDKLYATAFNYTDVQAVYIPEGITEIE